MWRIRPQPLLFHKLSNSLSLDLRILNHPSYRNSYVQRMYNIIVHHSTIATQLLKLLSRCEFEVLAKRHVVANLAAQPGGLHHLGIGRVARPSLARVNAEQELCEDLFSRPLRCCRGKATEHGFGLRHRLFLLDCTTADLYLSMFPRARSRRRKGSEAARRPGPRRSFSLRSRGSSTEGRRTLRRCGRRHA